MDDILTIRNNQIKEYQPFTGGILNKVPLKEGIKEVRIELDSRDEKVDFTYIPNFFNLIKSFIYFYAFRPDKEGVEEKKSGIKIIKIGIVDKNGRLRGNFFNGEEFWEEIMTSLVLISHIFGAKFEYVINKTGEGEGEDVLNIKGYLILK